jgi:hypothetical protein
LAQLFLKQKWFEGRAKDSQILDAAKIERLGVLVDGYSESLARLYAVTKKLVANGNDEELVNVVGYSHGSNMLPSFIEFLNEVDKDLLAKIKPLAIGMQDLGRGGMIPGLSPQVPTVVRDTDIYNPRVVGGKNQARPEELYNLGPSKENKSGAGSVKEHNLDRYVEDPAFLAILRNTGMAGVSKTPVQPAGPAQPIDLSLEVLTKALQDRPLAEDSYGVEQALGTDPMTVLNAMEQALSSVRLAFTELEGGTSLTQAKDQDTATQVLDKLTSLMQKMNLAAQEGVGFSQLDGAIGELGRLHDTARDAATALESLNALSAMSGDDPIMAEMQAAQRASIVQGLNQTLVNTDEVAKVTFSPESYATIVEPLIDDFNRVGQGLITFEQAVKNASKGLLKPLEIGGGETNRSGQGEIQRRTPQSLLSQQEALLDAQQAAANAPKITEPEPKVKLTRTPVIHPSRREQAEKTARLQAEEEAQKAKSLGGMAQQHIKNVTGEEYTSLRGILKTLSIDAQRIDQIVGGAVNKSQANKIDKQVAGTTKYLETTGAGQNLDASVQNAIKLIFNSADLKKYQELQRNIMVENNVGSQEAAQMITAQIPNEVVAGALESFLMAAETQVTSKTKAKKNTVDSLTEASKRSADIEGRMKKVFDPSAGALAHLTVLGQQMLHAAADTKVGKAAAGAYKGMKQAETNVLEMDQTGALKIAHAVGTMVAPSLLLNAGQHAPGIVGAAAKALALPGEAAGNFAGQQALHLMPQMTGEMVPVHLGTAITAASA